MADLNLVPVMVILEQLAQQKIFPYAEKGVLANHGALACLNDSENPIIILLFVLLLA